MVGNVKNLIFNKSIPDKHSDWLDDTRSFSRNYQPSLSNCKDWQPVHVPVRMCFLLWLLMYLFIDIILWPLVHDTTLGFIPSISGNLVQGLPIITTYVTRVLQILETSHNASRFQDTIECAIFAQTSGIAYHTRRVLSACSQAVHLLRIPPPLPLSLTKTHSLALSLSLSLSVSLSHALCLETRRACSVAEFLSVNKQTLHWQSDESTGTGWNTWTWMMSDGVY
jgi:hypothetical protein